MNKYLLVYETIKRRINMGEYPEASLLPFENELTNEFSVSRGTIRQALNMLENEGIILKIKGKGSLVQKRKHSLAFNSIISFKELSENMKLDVRTEVVDLSLMNPDDYICSMLEINKTQKVWKIDRIRYLNNVPSIFDTDYILFDVVPTLSIKNCKESIYNYIENELGVHPALANKVIKIESPTIEEQEYLKINKYEKLAVVRSQVYTRDNILFQYTISKHIPEVFEFVSVAKR